MKPWGGWTELGEANDDSLFQAAGRATLEEPDMEFTRVSSGLAGAWEVCPSACKRDGRGAPKVLPKVLAVTFGLVGAGCGSHELLAPYAQADRAAPHASRSDKDEHSEDATSRTSSDSEHERADAPVMVTGAFISGIGPVQYGPSEVLVPAGEEIFGAGLYSVRTGHKVRMERDSVELTLHFADGMSLAPPLVEAGGDSPWHVYFSLPEGLMGQVLEAVLVVRSGGKVFRSQVKDLNYRPSHEAIVTDSDDLDSLIEKARSTRGKGRGLDDFAKGLKARSNKKSWTPED